MGQTVQTMQKAPGRPATVNDYIGIPWVQGESSRDGADCWGLVLLVSREVFGIDLGLYEGAKFTGDDLARIIEGEERSSRWKLTDAPRAGDVVTIRRRGDPHPSHVGIMVDCDNVLHSVDISANGSSAVHPMKVLRRIFGRIETYKHANDSDPT